VTNGVQQPPEAPTPPNTPGPQPQSAAYWTQPRLELREWFNRNAPSLGELYEGALRMLYGENNFPGTTRFVAHAVREIRNRLPDVIAGRRGGTFDWKTKLDELAKDWQRAGFSLDGVIPTEVTAGESVPSTDVRMPRRLMQNVAILLKDHVEAREKPKEAAIRLFRSISPENNHSLHDSLRPVINQWFEVTEWFVKNVHEGHDQNRNTDLKELKKYFELFESTLGALIRGFFKTVEGLDEILEDTNS
jgi:hypothetical protein